MDLKEFNNPKDNISFAILHKKNNDEKDDHEKDDHGKVPIEIENKLPGDSSNKQYSSTIEPQTSSDRTKDTLKNSDDNKNSKVIRSIIKKRTYNNILRQSSLYGS